MTIDGPAGFVMLALVAIVLFVGLIGGLVWLYSAQSTKRRRSEAGEPAGVKERHGN